MQKHDVVHVSLLKRYHGETPNRQLSLIVDGQEEYEVEPIWLIAIAKLAKTEALRPLLIKCKGFGPEHNS